MLSLSPHSHGNYFSADRSRFGCGAYLNVCRSGRCVKVAVTDYGPSCFVENDAGGPVLDASPGVGQMGFHLFLLSFTRP
jgi:hypothetical protein